MAVLSCESRLQPHARLAVRGLYSQAAHSILIFPRYRTSLSIASRDAEAPVTGCELTMVKEPLLLGKPTVAS